MRRSVNIALVQSFVVVQVLIATSIASAQMKVACVGDSITALPSGWCGYLGTDLGSGYTAMTFGVSGTTLLKNTGGLGSYSASSGYKPSHDFAPNIVVIMLGTNDSMPRNWDTGKSHFVADYKELIASYTSLPTKPLVILNTAPPASDDNMFTISGTTIEKEVNPLIKQVAMETMCPLADVWTACGGDVKMLGSADGVHPGAAGSKLIADAVYKTIMSPVIPGGSAGMGASAGAGGGSANASGAGGGGQAGASANSGGAGGANTGGANAAAVGGANAAAAGRTGMVAGAAATSAIAGASGNLGSSMNTRGNPSAAGAGGAATTGNTGTAVNTIMGAGMAAPVVSNTDSGGGCRTAGNSTSANGAAAALLLLLGLVLRSRRRSRS
jgi:acyl-CoA thioesterase-1